MYLHDDGWTKAETDHLFDLCKRFDLRFTVVHDRYDHQQYRVMWLLVTMTQTHLVFVVKSDGSSVTGRVGVPAVQPIV